MFHDVADMDKKEIVSWFLYIVYTMFAYFLIGPLGLVN